MEQIQRRGHWEGELWNRVHSGEVKRHELTIQAVQNEVGELIHYVGMLHDVSHRYQQEAEILFQARHDYLTGLANRAELVEQMDQSLAQARRYGQRVALLFLDLDGFKPINDELGHAMGDEVLQVIARRLQEVVRESDTLCRQGGDEFVLLIPQAGDNEDLRFPGHEAAGKGGGAHRGAGPLRLSVSIGSPSSIRSMPPPGRNCSTRRTRPCTAPSRPRQEQQGEIAMAIPAGKTKAPTTSP